jgi:hypothetical protein
MGFNSAFKGLNMFSHLPSNSLAIDHTSVAAKIFQGEGAIYRIVLPSREQEGI